MHIRVGYDLLPLSSSDADDPARQHALLARLRYCRSRLPHHRTLRADHGVSRPLRQLVHHLVAPAGQMRFSSRGVVRDSGQPDVVVPSAPSMRWRICRKRRSSSCAGAATVKPMCCRRWRGTYLQKRHPDGRVSRRSAITSIPT